MNNYRTGISNSIPPVTLNLIIINVIVWLAQSLLFRRGIDISNFLGLHYIESPAFQIYQPITYMFLHDPRSFIHVFSNMFAVFMFGRFIEQYWGSKRFISYYFITGIGAAAIQMLVVYFRLLFIKNGMSDDAISEVYANGHSIIMQGMNYSDPLQGNLNMILNNATIGASGAVFGILLAFAMIFPNVEMMIIPIPVPIKAKWLVLGYGFVELFFGVANFSGDNVAHFAHLGGMLFGLIAIFYWKKKDRKDGRFN